MHVEDLIQVERALGYTYESDDAEIGHYQWICPPCRRAMFALAQGRLKATEPSTEPVRSRPVMPAYATLRESQKRTRSGKPFAAIFSMNWFFAPIS